MKDLYTFDCDNKAAQSTYDEVIEAYNRIFNRIGVQYTRGEAFLIVAT